MSSKGHPPVIPNFIRQGLRGGSLVVHGDGNQTRDFIFVNDVVRAMIGAATATTINQADISLAHEKLEYKPRYDLDEGLRLTLEQDERFRGKMDGGNKK